MVGDLFFLQSHVYTMAKDFVTYMGCLTTVKLFIRKPDLFRVIHIQVDYCPADRYYWQPEHTINLNPFE